MRDRWQNRPNRPFDRDYWKNRPGNGRHWHWHAHWHNHSRYWWWRPCTWGAIGGWVAYGWTEPYYYDYGNTIIYQDDNVYYGDQQVATSEEYYQQAENIADNVPTDVDEEKVEWLPLGVFAIGEKDVADSSMLMQLAVSKEGIIAGTYVNDITKSSRPLEGTVDKKTQRAAWKFADEEEHQLVFETGIYNLTKDESKLLVHFGADRTQTWTMIRLPAPEEEEGEQKQPEKKQPE